MMARLPNTWPLAAAGQRQSLIHTIIRLKKISLPLTDKETDFPLWQKTDTKQKKPQKKHLQHTLQIYFLQRNTCSAFFRISGLSF